MGGLMEIPKKKPKLYQQFLITILILAVISVINILLERIIQPSSLVFIYLIATIISASFFGTWPAILTSLAGLLVYEFLFTEPKFKFSMYHAQDIYNVTVFFIVAIIVIKLIKTVQSQNLIVQFRLDRASFVEDMSRDFLIMTPIENLPEDERTKLIKENAINAIGKIIVKHTRKIIDVPAFVSFRHKNGPLKIGIKSDVDLEIKKEDLHCANWVISEGKVSGSGIDPDSKTRFFFIPLNSHEQTIGVLGVQYDYKKLSPEQQSLLRSLSNFASMAAERWIT